MSAVGTSGLQRRRGGAGANGSASPAAGPSTPTGSGPGGASASAAAAVASGALGKAALTGDHRIAYDPRDLDDPQETRAHPRLTLMDECLLLGLKDRQVRAACWRT
jgi:Golgi phosphoprotein 3